MDVLQFEHRAQTNIQLYGQLLASGYGRDEMIAARDAYMFAAQIFASQLRPEGRPFVCHVVGVASILAMIGASVETVHAGLLHSAYTHGDLGYGRGRFTAAARDRVRNAVGRAVETLLDCYSQHPWNRATVVKLIAHAHSDLQLRQVALIRLADALEDALDYGLELSKKSFNPQRLITVEDLVDLAVAVDHPELVAPLRRVLDHTKSIPAPLRALHVEHAGSYLVCPLSWREKSSMRVFRLARRVRNTLSGRSAALQILTI